MTKEVLISIKGLRFFEEKEEDDEVIEFITYGQYYYRNGKHYILYEEPDEQTDTATHNTFKFCEGFFELTKKGTVSAHMVFEKGKKNQTYYCTPFGNLLLGIEADGIQMEEKKDSIDVKVDYGLELNYRPIAQCDISVHVEPRNLPERA